MREDGGRDERRWMDGEGGLLSLRLNFLESLQDEMSVDVKRKIVCMQMKTVPTRIWGRLGTGERHGHEESGGLVVKVFA